MAFKYFEPSKDLGPKNMPDKEKYPGKWKFYEVNLDAIKEQVATNVYIGGGKDMTQEEVEEREEFLAVLRAYLDRRSNRRPDPGAYDAEKPEKHVAEVNFDKMQSRAQYYDEDFDNDLDKEGDVLILDPREPQEKVPGFDMGKQAGRGDDFAELEEQKDELVLNPRLEAVKKRQGLGGAIPLEKQVGRPVEQSIDDDEVFAIPTDTAAIPNDPSQPRVKGVDLSKKPERFQYEPLDSIAEHDELLMPAEYKPLDREKVLFKMDKAPERFPQQIDRNPNYDLADLATDTDAFLGTDLADVGKAYKATLPHVQVPDLSKN